MSIEECHDYLLHGEDPLSKELVEQSLNEIETSERRMADEATAELPASLSVLFVDDDMVLRKLFSFDKESNHHMDDS